MSTHPLGEKWWHENAQYRRSLRPGVTMDQVDSAMQRVAEVFDTDWCSTNRNHPVYFQINSRGLNPFQFLSDLGMDLISVATCLRHKRLIEDLKQTETFSSAFLELFIAAQLQRHGHCVELRPELPNGKNADLLTKEDALGVYFEIKQLDRSDAHKAVEQLSLALLLAMADLQRSSVWPKDHGYEIALSEKTLQSLDSGCDADQVVGKAAAIWGEI